MTSLKQKTFKIKAYRREKLIVHCMSGNALLFMGWLQLREFKEFLATKKSNSAVSSRKMKRHNFSIFIYSCLA